MTIESDGQTYSFRGRLINTAINYEYDDVLDYRASIELPVRRQVASCDLSIQITSDITRAVVPKKAKHVQR